MKIYTLEHQISKRRFRITASNFDDAVSRTFDIMMSHWICLNIEPVESSLICNHCNQPIQADDTMDHGCDDINDITHVHCPLCIDCKCILGSEDDIYHLNKHNPLQALTGQMHICLKCAYERGIVKNTPANQSSTENHHTLAYSGFFNQLAHDMASPMHFLQQYIHTLSTPKNKFTDMKDSLSSAAKTSYSQLQHLLTQLRDFCHEPIISKQDTDLSQTIRDIINMMIPIASQKNIQIQFNGPSHLIAHIDAHLIERSIANMCINAIEAMTAPGMIILSLMHDNNTVWIDIMDTGCGIQEKYIDNVFDYRFTHNKEHGSGLGLSFCKQVMDAHGGSIGVSSKEYIGTTFSLVFPNTGILKAESLNNDAPNNKVMITLFDTNHHTQDQWVEHVYKQYADADICINDQLDDMEDYSMIELTMDHHSSNTGVEQAW